MADSGDLNPCPSKWTLLQLSAVCALSGIGYSGFTSLPFYVYCKHSELVVIEQRYLPVDLVVIELRYLQIDLVVIEQRYLPVVPVRTEADTPHSVCLVFVLLSSHQLTGNLTIDVGYSDSNHDVISDFYNICLFIVYNFDNIDRIDQIIATIFYSCKLILMQHDVAGLEVF
ncbi:hypothetical protein Btru_046134 [Bulinus truncatus]|nr:hypothetical protein Btru_046134 [Bulinus truncatus]